MGDLRHRQALVGALTLAAAWACTACDHGGSSGLEPRFSVLQEKVFTPKCTLSSCHSVPFHAGGLVLVEGHAYDGLMGGPVFQANANADGLKRVVPGDAASSFLWLKLQRDLDPAYGSSMPYASGEGLPDDELGAIEHWIEGGAKDD